MTWNQLAKSWRQRKKDNNCEGRWRVPIFWRMRIRDIDAFVIRIRWNTDGWKMILYKQDTIIRSMNLHCPCPWGRRWGQNWVLCRYIRQAERTQNGGTYVLGRDQRKHVWGGDNWTKTWMKYVDVFLCPQSSLQQRLVGFSINNQTSSGLVARLEHHPINQEV